MWHLATHIHWFGLVVEQMHLYDGGQLKAYLRAYVKWQNLIYLIITTVFEFFSYGKFLLFPLAHTQTSGDFSPNQESRLVPRGRVECIKLLFRCVWLWSHPFLTEPFEYALVVGFMNLLQMFGALKLGVSVCFWGFEKFRVFPASVSQLENRIKVLFSTVEIY